MGEGVDNLLARSWASLQPALQDASCHLTLDVLLAALLIRWLKAVSQLQQLTAYARLFLAISAKECIKNCLNPTKHDGDLYLKKIDGMETISIFCKFCIPF